MKACACPFLIACVLVIKDAKLPSESGDGRSDSGGLQKEKEL